MLTKKAFTLTEILIAVMLVGLVIMAASSVDISSRQFLRTIERQIQVQDEAKIAMQHIAKNLQLGIGNMTNPGSIGNPPLPNNSRGFYILDGWGNLANSGSIILVKRDGLHGPGDGQFNPADPNDGISEYRYMGNPDFKIIYDPDIAIPGSEDNFTDGIVNACNFSIDSAPNQVEVSIETLHDPLEADGLDNPHAILTSSIVLRAMSCN